MRRAFRHLFTLCSALLLCVAAVVLLVRSYWRADTMWYSVAGSGARELGSMGGELYYRSDSDAILAEPWGVDSRPPEEWGVPPRQLGWFTYRRDGDFFIVGLPYWFLALLTSIVPVLWLIRARRFPKGHCRQCGYDLRAHREGERCPECGTANPQAG